MSGLAIPTVSRALHDAPDIGGETKRRVKEIAREIGYVPNRAGVRLRTGRTYVISLILSAEHDMMNHTARLISTIAGALRGTQYHLIITPFFPDQDPMEPVRYVVENGTADAVIINQTKPDDPRVSYLVERGFPFAAHGRTNLGLEHAYYDYDNAEFARLGVRALAEKGARNIAVIGPPRDQTYGRDLFEAAFDEARAQGVDCKAVPEVTSDDNTDVILRQFAAFCEAAPEVDGVICASISAATAAVGVVEASGKQLGRDVNVFSKETVEFLNLFRPELLAIHEDTGRGGEFLARAAIAAIEHPDNPPMQFLEVPQMSDVKQGLLIGR